MDRRTAPHAGNELACRHRREKSASNQAVLPSTDTFLQLTRSFPEERDDPVRDFLVTAQSDAVRIEVTVRTSRGDGLDVFSPSWRKSSAGGRGAGPWHSLERDLTLSAETARLERHGLDWVWASEHGSILDAVVARHCRSRCVRAALLTCTSG
ncbi:DUF6228 family protein [Streptomyces sp. CA-251387]|uniref:DUF6228 family protein n=1 Tax=Streptomyces sp. CA-251387 TaxID=3240064 RepID=UPI003D900740